MGDTEQQFQQCLQDVERNLRSEIEQEQEIYWCAWCGKHGDHRSGGCPDYLKRKSNARTTTKLPL